MTTLRDDLWLGRRRLARSPAFTAVVVTTLALAIGANAAVFGLVDSMLLTPLPLPQAERIVRLWEERPSRGWARFGVSAPTFLDWRRDARSFSFLVAFTGRAANLAGSGDPQRIEVTECTADLAGVLGSRPRLGRFFRRDEEARGRDAVVVLSDESWRSAFGSRADVVGTEITLDGVPHVVIGVMPPEASAAFAGSRIWRPLALEGDVRRGARWLAVMGRLAPGSTLAASRAELAVLARRHERDHPATNTGWTATAVSLEEVRTEAMRPLLLAVWAAVALVLLVASANVAGLMLTRVGEREAELAVRAALGAPPARIARLLATEGVMLAVLGGVLGVPAALAARAAVSLVLDDVTGAFTPTVLGGRLVASVAAATAVTAIALAAASARSARAPLEASLRASSRGATPSRLRARRALAVAEMAVAVVLVSGTGLLVRTVHRLVGVSPGFDPGGVLVARVAPAQSRPAPGQSEAEFVRTYLAERDRAAVFYDRLLERLRALPGVTVAGAVNRLPLTGRWWAISAAAEDQPSAATGETPSAAGRVATPGYFEAMRIPLRAGRLFAPSDGRASAPVAVISESLARLTWPGRAAIGRRMVIDDQRGVTVVGVVGDVRVEGLDAAAPPIVYVPFAQAAFGLFPDWGMDLVVRTRAEPSALAAALRAEVAGLDPALPVFAVRTADDVLGGWMARRRAALILFGAFAVITVTLAAVGLHGVLAQAARQRTREIGVRVALGARPLDIARLVLGEGLSLAAAGVMIGVAAATVTGRVLSGLLYGVTPGDPATIAATAAVLSALAVGIASGPARRASRVDPLVALRQD
jgi:predicted permease